MEHRSRALSAILTVVLIGGCGGGGGGSGFGGGKQADHSAFPTQEEIERVRETPVSRFGWTGDIQHVDRWKLAGPLPSRLEARAVQGEGPWGALLTREVERRPGIAISTEAMQCTAREYGRFWLAHDATPALVLQTFIASRCGVASQGVRFNYLTSRDIDPAIPMEELFEAWRESAEALVVDHLVSGPLTAGIWMGREGPRVTLVLATGKRIVRLDPIDLEPRSGTSITISGDALITTDGVGATATRGRYGFAECLADETVRLPRFRFECPIDPTDRKAWIQLSVGQPGRVLAQVGATILLRPGGGRWQEFRMPSYVRSGISMDPDDVAGSLVDLVNRVRGDAGLDPLELAEDQAEIAEELAPHYFASQLGDSPEEIGDLVVLGMMAGWNVEGLVQRGEIASAWVAQSDDLAALVSIALEYPFPREALLGPDMRRIAVGGVVYDDEEGLFMAALFATYQLFDEDDHAALKRRALATIDRARRARGVGRARRLPSLRTYADWAASRVGRGDDPDDVFGELLQSSVNRLNRSARGWIIETGDLDDFQIPEELLARSHVSVSASVSVRRREDEPWGTYVVMLVVADDRGRGA